MSILQPLNAMSVATTHTENNPRIVSHNRPSIHKEVANGQHMSIEDWWKNTGNDIYNKVINPTPKWNLEKPAEYQPDGALKAKQDFWDASRKYDQGVQQPVLRNNMLKTNELDFNDIKAVQQWLTNNGFDTKGVDGMYGANTRNAIDSMLNSTDFTLTAEEKEKFRNFQNSSKFYGAKTPAHKVVNTPNGPVSMRPDAVGTNPLNLPSFPGKSFKRGGLIKKHQQGGNMEDMQAQVKQLVQAVAAGDQQAAEQVKQIMQAAEQGDQQALQIAQMIQAEIEAIKSAKRGAKLNYIKSLKGDCPDGEEVVYFQKGGQLCKACQKKHDKMIAEKGKKLNPVEEFKKGRKTKKC